MSELEGYCRVAGKLAVDKRKSRVGSIRKACRELAKESGIPAGTLRDWYLYPDGKVKVAEISASKPPEITTETKIKGVITRLKAATTIIESLDDAFTQTIWQQLEEAHKALNFAISQAKGELL